MVAIVTPRARYDLRKTTDRALRHVHVSGALDCTPEEFAAALKTGSIDQRTTPAVRLFLEEGEEHLFVDIVAQGASSFATLAKLARDLLPPTDPTIRFLTEPPL